MGPGKRKFRSQAGRRLRRGVAPALLGILILTGGCASTRHVPDGSYLLDKVKIFVDSTDSDISSEELMYYLRQQPNRKTLWSTRLRLGVYNMSGSDTT